MPDPSDPQVKEALERASDALGLPAYYRSCVRPLLRNPEGRWPRCCGAGCEPCAETLIQVALQVLQVLGTPRVTPVDQSSD